MKVLLSQRELQDGVTRLADQVNRLYAGEPLTIVGIMTGSIMLMADLIRLLEMPLRVGVIQTSSYRAGSQRAPLIINEVLLPDIRGRDVLLVDDIFDTGQTLAEVTRRIEQHEPRSIRSAVLLHKRGRQEVTFRPDFVLFEIPDQFVVGYGLDYLDEFRNLPFVAALESSELRVDHL